LFPDFLSVFQDIKVPAVILIGRSDVIDGLMIPVIVVVIDPFPNPLVQLCGTEVVIQQDKVFHRAMIALYLPLGHGMIDSSADVPDILLFQVALQLSGDVAGAVITEKPWSLHDMDMLDFGSLYGHIQSLLDILSLHGPAELPGKDVSRVIIHDC